MAKYFEIGHEMANLASLFNSHMRPAFFKENVRYPVCTYRDPIFSVSRDPMTIFSDSRDPIFNSRDANRVPKTP